MQPNNEPTSNGVVLELHRIQEIVKHAQKKCDSVQDQAKVLVDKLKNDQWMYEYLHKNGIKNGKKEIINPPNK